MFNLLDESVSCQVLRCRRPAYVSARGHRRSRRPPSCSASTAPGSATPTEPSDFSPWSSPSLTVRADAGSDVCSGVKCYYWHHEWDRISFCQQPMRCCSRSSATLCPPTATTSTTRPSERIRPPTSPAAVHRTPTPSPDRWQQRLYKESSTKTTFSNVCPSQ